MGRANIMVVERYIQIVDKAGIKNIRQFFSLPNNRKSRNLTLNILERKREGQHYDKDISQYIANFIYWLFVFQYFHAIRLHG